MKRLFASFMLFVMLFLGGCGFWIDNERLYVTPHLENMQHNADEVVFVETYDQMEQVVLDKMESGANDVVVSVSSYSEETAVSYVEEAVRYALESTPIGAYAVNDITYEIGINRGKPVIAFHFNYRHGIGDIMRIKTAENTEDAINHIIQALIACEDSLVFLSKNHSEIDIAQQVADYANMHPDEVMELPQVRVAFYPDSGEDRIVEVSFTYQNSRADLRKMQEQVEDVFTSAELYVQQTNVKEIFSRLYTFLMKRNEYTVETSITPAYSLLHHGVGDSRAFASVYAAMCRREELDCRVISGTKNGEPWFWNVVRYRGKYYHIDLLACNESGGFRMLHDSEMNGYVWDYSAI